MLNRPLTSSSTDISTETGEVDAVLWLWMPTLYDHRCKQFLWAYHSKRLSRDRTFRSVDLHQLYSKVHGPADEGSRTETSCLLIKVCYDKLIKIVYIQYIAMSLYNIMITDVCLSVCLCACPFVCLSVWLKNWIADIANFCSTWHSNVPQTSWRSCQTGHCSCLHVSTYMYHISYMYILHVYVHVYSNMYMHDSRQVQTGVNELCRDSCVSVGSTRTTTVNVCHSLWHCVTSTHTV